MKRKKGPLEVESSAGLRQDLGWVGEQEEEAMEVRTTVLLKQKVRMEIQRVHQGSQVVAEKRRMGPPRMVRYG